MAWHAIAPQGAHSLAAGPPFRRQPLCWQDSCHAAEGDCASIIQQVETRVALAMRCLLSACTAERRVSLVGACACAFCSMQHCDPPCSRLLTCRGFNSSSNPTAMNSRECSVQLCCGWHCPAALYCPSLSIAIHACTHTARLAGVFSQSFLQSVRTVC